jgi:hypothetical protein
MGITLPFGCPTTNVIWTGGIRTVQGQLQQSGDAILAFEFAMNGAQTAITACRYMKSNDGNTWRTDNIVAEFVGFAWW